MSKIKKTMKLGVNIDHVATLRQARYRSFRTVSTFAEPNLMDAAFAVEKARAHGITIHLREDRRHIQDADVKKVREECHLPLNLEMSANEEILRLALKLKPAEVCLVPERREEVTTEGGLDVVGGLSRVAKFTAALQKRKIVVSLFIAPNLKQVKAAADSGAEFIELHTGAYAEAQSKDVLKKEVLRLKNASELAFSLGLRVNAGHGLRYTNLKPILDLPHLETLNIGHSIISRALTVGLFDAIREMLQLINRK